VADRRRVDRVLFITHREVRLDRSVPVPEWGLSDCGRARMNALAAPVDRVRAIWSSAERKAVEAAAILADRLAPAPRILHELGENDRSATGFLEPDVFEATADRFFAEPDRSVDRWGTVPIARALDQPGQGHWFAFEREGRRVLHGWRRIGP